jgi:hypothetical protein
MIFILTLLILSLVTSDSIVEVWIGNLEHTLGVTLRHLLDVTLSKGIDNGTDVIIDLSVLILERIFDLDH